MPKGYRKPADWDGFAMAIADAQHDEQLAAVKHDDPRVRIPQNAVWAEVKRERDQLRARLVEAERLIVEYQQIAESRSAEIKRLQTEQEGLLDTSRTSTEAMDRARLKIDELRAENAELRKNLVDTETAARWGEQTENQLEAEIERLRAALAEMLESFTEPEDDNDILRRARAALVRPEE